MLRTEMNDIKNRNAITVARQIAILSMQLRYHKSADTLKVQNIILYRPRWHRHAKSIVALP
jgi:hypothetical protein